MEDKMKRNAWILSLVLVISLLVSCSSEPTADENDGESTVADVTEQMPLNATDVQATLNAAVYAAFTQTADAQQLLDATQTVNAAFEQAVVATREAVDSNAIQLAYTFDGSENRDWQPVERVFDGVTMVLVPRGCFRMGSNIGDSDEQPVYEQCFDEPFWIDKYEVTNEQYGFSSPVAECNAVSSRPNQPRNCISWFDANDFCQARGGYLPTEAQWEYAARGVESWIFPWGDEYTVRDIFGFYDTSDEQTFDVGSYPEEASWVGAFDMSTNLPEWVSSLYQEYPYTTSAESERDTSSMRSVRGGGVTGQYFLSRCYALRIEQAQHLVEI
jgi:formylglycine-generating enzyme required for sulfatase activity